MKGQLSTEGRIYLGDIQSDWHYLSSIRTISAKKWEWEFKDTSFLGELPEFSLILTSDKAEEIYHSETRFMDHLPSFLIMDDISYSEMDENERQKLLLQAVKKVPNPDFKTFEQYTHDVMKEGLLSPESCSTMDLETAKKYRDAISSYAESLYSSPELVKVDYSAGRNYFLIYFSSKHRVELTVSFNKAFELVKVEMFFQPASEESWVEMNDSLE